MKNLKYDTNEFIYFYVTHAHRNQTLGYHRGKGGGGINWEFGISRFRLLYLIQRGLR